MTTRAAAHRRSFGLETARQLDDRGIDRRVRRRLLASGQLTRPCHGWYAWPGHDVEAANALRVRGRVTCAGALKRHGVWVRVTPPLHIRVAAGALTPRLMHAITHRLRDCPLGDSPVDAPLVALRCALQCLEPLDALVVADSMLNLRLATEEEVCVASQGAPRAVRRALRLVDGRSQSGTETIVRAAFQRRGVRVRTQAFIPGIGFVDLLVGDRLIIECDSRAHHTDVAAYVRDRHRDLAAAERGYHPVRLTHADVVDLWPRTWNSFERLLCERVHLWTSSTRRLAEAAAAVV
ncbi:hypothetical protein GCM10011490_13720 [Pseudoclavibacter endophyticus]|nr:hypothetical protein GCM10011490_13720 [Pseudoclavibacter endophyticus]